MSKFFSFKLYREGIKKSRLLGITGTAVVSILCALIPLVQILTPRYYEPGYTPSTEIIEPAYFAIPLLILLVFAPALVTSMFSYLNKRNESDFYHSIPFTRPCVYFSFLTAAFTWVVFALVLSLVATSLLWLAVPYTAFSFTTPLVLFGAYFLACLLMAAFMAVAMTLTGTTVSNGLIFILLFGFVRLSGAFFILALESQYPILVTALTPARLLSIDYSMPISLLVGTVNGSTQVFSNVGVWIYTAIISILLIAAGCFFYWKRRSEMAGQSAPNRILQHVYRCAITLPMAFLIAFYIIDMGLEFDVLIVLVVLTLLLYYLFEIITTKKLKNCLSATPYLLVVLAGGILFGVSIPLAGNAAVNYTPDADEIKSVSLYVENDPYSDTTYEAGRTGTVEISSPEALKMIADELAEMKATIQSESANEYLYPDRYGYGYGVIVDDFYKEEIIYERITLKITDKSGIVRGRTLCFTSDEYRKLLTIFTETKEYENALLSLPTDDEILDIWVRGSHYYYTSGESERVCQEIWESFVKEYNKLTREEKVAYKTENLYSDLAIEVRGMIGMESFYRDYHVDIERFPETAKLMVNTANLGDSENYWAVINSLKADPSQYVYMDINTVENRYDHGIYSSVQGQAETYLEALEYLNNCSVPNDGDMVLLTVSVNSNYYYAYRYFILSETDFATFCEMAGVVITEEEIKDPVVME